MQLIAIIGGGPASLYLFKRLVDRGQKDLRVHIFEKGDRLGCGMPYGHDGSADEHITNVSGNEIPELVTPLADWVRSVPKDTLDKYHIDPENFNDDKVLPRLLFGQYLCDQYKLLLKQAKTAGLEVSIAYHTTVTDIRDEGNRVRVLSGKGEQTFDRVIVCTGHSWPKHHEGAVPGWYDSPYPPEKLAQQANFPVAVRGASLTAVDAIRTLARHNGRFEKDAQGILYFHADPGREHFRIVMHTRNGLLPAVRFHLEDAQLGKDSVLSEEQIATNRAANDGFSSLDDVFDQHFKAAILKHDPTCYQEIKDMNMEAFVDHVLTRREEQDPFVLLKKEYAEAERSIRQHQSVYWKEQLAILSFVMNYPAKYFSAEDWQRLQQTLMPLISVVIAFIPQSSAEMLMALHAAGCLSMVVVDEDVDPSPAENGADYNGVHYDLFVDCIGQPHLAFEQIPFEGLRVAGSPARLAFRDRSKGWLTVPGLAINDHFQLVDRYGALNERIYIMAVPFIGGFNPDYSGLDFGEAASAKIIETLLAG